METMPRCLFPVMFSFAAYFSFAQVLKPFGSIYSHTIRGRHTMFGNTISAIYSSGCTGTIGTAKMNFFDATVGFGKISSFGNDGSNIQLVNVDGNLVAPPTNLLPFGNAAWA